MNALSEKIAVVYQEISLKNSAQILADKLNLNLIYSLSENNYKILLMVSDQGLELFLPDEKNLGSLRIDFLSSASLYRHQHGGGRKQLLARAIGLHKKKNLVVSDLSAGLGRDAFVLACLGAQVTMIERSPIICALLENGLKRAQEIAWIKDLTWRLICGDSRDYLQSLLPEQYPEVIYFDPMFPERKKSALVKKEMRILKEIAGEDVDAPELLSLALEKALKRVVVKRPKLAPPIEGQKPDFSLIGQSSRFDIYSQGVLDFGRFFGDSH